MIATVAKLRDALAVGLIALRVTPNMLTIAGFVLTGIAAGCLVFGAGNAAPWEHGVAPVPTSWWPLLAAVVLNGASAFDMLDGTVARLGKSESRFGAILDSTLDRFSDLFVFLGCAIHFSLSGNVTYVALSGMAAGNAVLISYVKARTENLIEGCGVGFWQRGERCVLFLAAAYLGHIPAALWMLALFPLGTVFRRIRHAHRMIVRAGDDRGPAGLAAYLTPWRHPRGSAGYNLCAAAVLGFVIAAPLLWRGFYGGRDVIGVLLRPLVGR